MRAPDLTQWEEVWVDEILDDVNAEVMHLIPVADLVGHERGQDCVCGPYIEHLAQQDYVAVHYALDARP